MSYPPISSLLWCVCCCTFVVIAHFSHSSTGPLLAPSLSFYRPRFGRNIQLFSDVELICTLPTNVRLPITVSFSWDNQSLSAIHSLTIQNRDDVRFTTKAIAANEGIYVCWYNASNTGDVSGKSNPANLTICKCVIMSNSLITDYHEGIQMSCLTGAPLHLKKCK